MTRGLITIATGNKYYYELAKNLLISYRLKSANPLPFAIIAEEENEYTELFDDVILTTEAKRSFLDKFLLLKLCPYDETIFCDADILAYGDLNKYWELFQGATDFSSLGENCGLYENRAWYNKEDIWKYGNSIEYKCRVHMGVCFIRKSDTLMKLYYDCLDIVNNYDKLMISKHRDSVDEVAIAIAMPMNQMQAVDEHSEMMVTVPCATSLDADIYTGRLSYTTQWGKTVKENSLLIHFGTIHTKAPLYRFEVRSINYLLKKKMGKGTALQNAYYSSKLRRIFLKISQWIYKIF